MKLLVLGGTVFLGRHIVEAARNDGYEVTLFNRNTSAPGLFPDVERIVGDREGDLSALRGRGWDAVIDTCGYAPRTIRRSVEYLKDQTAHYTFISTVSVYKDWGTPQQDESSAVSEPLDDHDAEGSPENYGRLKLGCEKMVAGLMPAKALIIRPGLIAGPYDPTDRFTYWPARVSRGGEILAPGGPERTAQFIDVRDLAEWVVRMAAMRKTGVYNACGPALPMGEILKLCREETRSGAEFTWVEDAFLTEQGIAPYTELPLWIPGVGASFLARKARTEGLAWRPLRETIRDTLAWDASRPADARRRNGLSEKREKELLLIWRSKRRAAAFVVKLRHR